jgi:hypothetical protein
MIPVRENSEVVMKFTQRDETTIKVMGVYQSL